MRQLTLIPEKTRFGRLEVLGCTSISGFDNTLYECVCVCGEKVQVKHKGLKQKTTQSCGCLYRDNHKAVHTTHGKTNSDLHKLWRQIKSRCSRKTGRIYECYAKRGISVHKDWMTNFLSFEEWILKNLGPKPTPQHSLDRIDNDKGYEPGNVRWATSKEQMNNRRKVYTINETQMITASKRLNISVELLKEAFK